MGQVLRFPVDPEVCLKRLEAELAGELERERTVAEAFAAVDRGDFDAQAVRDVIRGYAGTLEEYLQLCERIKLVARAIRACGLFEPAPRPRCTCTTRCSSWPHCAGGPEGI